MENYGLVIFDGGIMKKLTRTEGAWLCELCLKARGQGSDARFRHYQECQGIKHGYANRGFSRKTKTTFNGYQGGLSQEGR